MFDTLELKNEVINHLSQFPYLKYSIREVGQNVYIEFSSDVDDKYAKNLLSNFKIEKMKDKKPAFSIKGIKNIMTYDEFRGKKIIGTTEFIEFPDINLSDLEAKVDSGAVSSSLHCETVSAKSGKVTFIALDPDYFQYSGDEITLPIHDTIQVQSSNGGMEKRYMVKLKVVINDTEIETYFTLTDRKDMEFPVLIGKDAVSGNFVIDPSY